MIQLSATSQQISLRFKSDITFVDHALELIRTLLSHQRRGDPTALLLVSRELLKNAVVHGNRNDPRKDVRYRLQHLGGGRYSVETEDHGEGFDGRRVRADAQRDAAHRQIARQGYEIICALADDIVFSERGNRVTVCLDVQG